jgi:uncharacterized membrane protein YhiD involved in acid resistance
MVDTMFDWLQGTVQSEHDVSAGITAAKLGLAFVFGATIALVHAVFRKGHDDRPNGLGTTLVLLCVIVALVTFVIGNNVARAFGLVGALSIVRFRTSVGDTRDTAFVIFAVAIGMAVGAGFLVGAAVAVPIVAASCGIVELMSRQQGRSSRIKLKAENMADGENAIREQHGKTIVRYRLLKADAGGKSKSVDLTYRIWLAQDAKPAALIDALHQRDGILRADWSVR